MTALIRFVWQQRFVVLFCTLYGSLFSFGAYVHSIAP